MKTIDIKSLLIGALLTTTIFLGVAATSPTDKWDGNQVWELKRMELSYKEEIVKQLTLGHEPFAATDKSIFFRKRIK